MWYSVKDNILDFRATLSNISGINAAKLAVESIQKNYKPPYYIMVSGGVDSQATLYAWHLFGKDFIPTSVIYDKEICFNKHDLVELETFSKHHNIEINYINFDLLSFYENDYDRVAHEFECSSPQITAHIQMTRNLPGTVIFSGTWLSKPKFLYNKVQHALTQYSQQRPCIPFFLLSHPDLAYTGVTLNLKGKKGLPKDVYASKVDGYHQAGFPVIAQEQKYTGFEKVKDYYDKHLWHLATPKMRIKYNSKPSKRTFDIVLRHPYEDKFGEIDFVFLLND